jgi:hypothetical protein
VLDGSRGRASLDLLLPFLLSAEVITPSNEAKGQGMKRIFSRYPDRAVHLMSSPADSDTRAVCRSLGDRDRRANNCWIVSTRRSANRRLQSRARESKFSGRDDKMVTHCLELSDGAAKLLSLLGMEDCQIDTTIHRANHLGRPRQRAA